MPPSADPNERLMMKYSPPPSTFKLVAISAIASPVGIVIKWPIRIMTIDPRRPVWATAYPNRKKSTAPKIVLIAARKTGAVPNLVPFYVF